MNQPHLANSDRHRPHGGQAAIYISTLADLRALCAVPLSVQVKETQEHCARLGLTPAQWFIEPDVADKVHKRRSFMEMVEIACAPARPFDVVLLHTAIESAQDSVDMDAAMKQGLARMSSIGIKFVLIVRPPNEDFTDLLARKLIGIFDEYRAREAARLKRLNRRAN